MKNRNDIGGLVRPDLHCFIPYENSGVEGVGMILLNANEAPYCPLPLKKLNRYPDPFQRELKRKLSEMFGLPEKRLFTGNGSDELIDLLIRGFCIPGSDSIAVLTPAYGMYAVCAALNGVKVISIPLDNRFQPDRKRILKEGKKAKILFICSPNNPTGNLIHRGIMEDLIRSFRGLVVVDEAYIDFSGDKGWIDSVSEYPNLLVLRTLSKSWGLAGARVGFLAGDQEIVKFLTAIKAPYNLSGLSIDAALTALGRRRFHRKSVKNLNNRREALHRRLTQLDCVTCVYPSDANFLLVKFRNGKGVFQHLLAWGILVRNAASLKGCSDCLRITVGNRRENRKLLKSLGRYREEGKNGKNFVS